MNLLTEKIGTITVVTMDMDVLDASNTDEFKQKIFLIFNNNHHIVLDMGKIRFIDSSGCGTLLSCLNRLKKDGGKLSIYGARENVRNLFELIRLDRLIDVFETKEAAIESF